MKKEFFTASPVYPAHDVDADFFRKVTGPAVLTAGEANGGQGRGYYRVSREIS